MRAERGIAPDAVLLVSVGRLEANKGFHVLAEALGHLVAHADGAGPGGGDLIEAIATLRWAVIGEGPFRPSIERAVQAAGLRDRVIMVGRATERDLHAWYEAATLFAHPTLYEGSSLVTLEAMAHRRAVVATAAGGLPDKVRPGLSGWLVPPSDAGALRLALAEALGDRRRLQAMGEHGRAIAVEHFSWPRVIDRFLDVCADTLAAREPAGS